jgi:hypothetical protein
MKQASLSSTVHGDHLASGRAPGAGEGPSRNGGDSCDGHQGDIGRRRLSLCSLREAGQFVLPRPTVAPGGAIPDSLTRHMYVSVNDHGDVPRHSGLRDHAGEDRQG